MSWPAHAGQHLDPPSQGARGDARKRMNPTHLEHHSPAVCDLLEQARDEGRIEGWRVAHLAFDAQRHADERAAAEVYE